MNIKTLLNQFYNVIQKGNNEFKLKYQNEIPPIFDLTEIENLRISANNSFKSSKIQNCALSSLLINVPNQAKDCKNPSGINVIKVKLEVAVTFNNSLNKKIIDPLNNLNFVIVAFSDKPDSYISWHLDRCEPNNTGLDFLHPQYHLTFGGKKIKEKLQKETQSDYFGNTLLLNTPRFMHLPMDIILGVDFVLNHYVAKEFSHFFIENKEYQRIVDKMKDFLWKPYALALASNFDSNNYNQIDKDFAKALLG